MTELGRRPDNVRTVHYSAAPFLPATVPQTPSHTPVAFPFAEADRCVLCGLCLPHCPTYRLMEDENESPRGRISLMRAVASGGLPASPAVKAHLSHCLGCRACERACPSGVRYGALLDAGRTTEFLGISNNRALRLGLWLLSRPRPLQAVAGLLRVYQSSGMQRVFRRSGLLRAAGIDRWDRALPPKLSTPSWPERIPALSAARGSVALFLGCVARHTDRNTIDAAIELLTRIGFDVAIPRGQTCCGALHGEAGDTGNAEALLTRNREEFGMSRVEAVITLATGCGAMLAERLHPGSSPPVLDIHAFLEQEGVLAHSRFERLEKTIAVQDPCSLRNVLRAEQSVYRLLARIPGLRISPLSGNSTCCGGAGGYPFREPRLADLLREPKLQSISEARPDLIVSANIGCALHLATGLRQRNLRIPVIHPVVLLAQQLRTDE